MPAILTASQSSSRTACKLAISMALVSPGVALAHPGHDAGFFSALLHPFIGWDHLLAAIAVGIWGARLGTRSMWLMPTVFVGAMLAGMALAATGFSVPMSEVGIALSIAVLGTLIVLDARLHALPGACLMALFALFHGAAHGAATVPLVATYALGITAGTILLHTIGIASAVALAARARVLRLAAAPVAITGMALLLLRLQ